MNFTHELDESSGVCTITVTGIVKRPDDSVILQQFALDLENKMDCLRFLFNMTKADFVGGTMDVYKTGSFTADTNHTQIRQKMALVYKDITEEHKFMETVAVNRGYQLRVFDKNGMNDAIEWLTN